MSTSHPSPLPTTPAYQPQRRLKLSHRVIVKAPGLLPMLYSPKDLEAELGVPARTIRGWLRYGLPYQGDATGHIWIDGQALAEWVKAHQAARHVQIPLGPSQAYCLTCQAAVTLHKPTPQQHGRRTLLRGNCPHCGRQVCRGIRRD